MARSPTAVAVELTLPAQPTSGGTVEIVPLGGDGFYSPQFAFNIKDLAALGTVTGGNVSLTVNMDPRYCSLVAFMTVQISQGTEANADVIMRLRSDRMAGPKFSAPVPSIDPLVSNNEIGSTWEPPPIVMPGGGQSSQIEALFVNVDADVYKLDALIYVFNIRAREMTPMGPLLWARGSR